MTNVFISYSRKDTEYTHEIVDAIKAKGLDAWVDWEGIPPTVDWMEQIQKGIAEADTFLFLLSPDSAASKVCGDELEYAAKNGKRIIPIVLRDVKPDDAPIQTRHLNWIFFRKDKENFEAALEKLVTAIKTDYGWVQAHRRLQVKALEWEKHNRESGYLLRGHDLQDAEAQHAMNSSKEPEPTDLQREYVFTSRKAVESQRRILTIISVVVAIALLGLGIFASIKAVEATKQAGIAQQNAEEALAQKTEAEKQRNEAEVQRQLAVENATLARAGELSARSTILRNSDFQLSMLLGLEANNLVDNTETRGALLDSAQAHPQLLQYYNNTPGAVYTIAYSLDGKILASGNAQGDIQLWNAASHEPIGPPFHTKTNGITDLAFNPDGTILAAASFDGSVALWDTANGKIVQQLSDNYAIYGYTTSVAFSPDGTIVVAGRGDESFVKRWDAKTGQAIGEPLVVDEGVNDLAFSPDGATLAVSNGDHVTLFNAVSGSSLQSLRGNAYDSINQLAFNTDGTVLAAGSYNHTIYLWDTASGANTAKMVNGAIIECGRCDHRYRNQPGWQLNRILQ
ncbi:MAG: TIR domain-containing protein [Anaerolineales bacterium]